MAEERIGFIGLGIMGQPMVANLIRAGFRPTVWNRSQPGIDACVALGAAAAESPRAVAEASDILITIVTDSPDVEQVLIDGPAAAIGGLSSGAAVVDMSTISPSVTQRIASQLAERGVSMLDAPVSGGDTGAKAGDAVDHGRGRCGDTGTLPPGAGGDGADDHALRPGRGGADGEAVQPGGDCGGRCWGYAKRWRCAGSRRSIRSGCWRRSAPARRDRGSCPTWGPKIAERDFAPGFMIRLMQKDLRLALERPARTCGSRCRIRRWCTSSTTSCRRRGRATTARRRWRVWWSRWGRRGSAGRTLSECASGRSARRRGRGARRRAGAWPRALRG